VKVQECPASGLPATSVMPADSLAVYVVEAASPSAGANVAVLVAAS
jgi:hypothetical protein